MGRVSEGEKAGMEKILKGKSKKKRGSASSRGSWDVGEVVEVRCGFAPFS